MKPTPDDPRKLLTDAQLLALRHVHLGTSKHIARALNKSSHTIDTQIRAAIHRLGVSDRHEAAALVQAWDEADTQSLGTQAPAVVFPPHPANEEEVEAIPAEAAGPPDRSVVQEDRVTFDPNFTAPASGLTGWKSWLLGDEKQSKAQRARTIVATVFISLIALLILFAVAESLTRTLLEISPTAV